MDATREASTRTAHGRGILGALWFSILIGPIATLTNEAVCYMLVFWSCGKLDRISSVLLHLIPAALALLVVGAGVLAWSHRTRPLSSAEAVTAEDHNRSGLMALLGVGLCAMSLLAIIAQWIPVLYLHPCMRT